MSPFIHACVDGNLRAFCLGNMGRYLAFVRMGFIHYRLYDAFRQQGPGSVETSIGSIGMWVRGMGVLCRFVTCRFVTWWFMIGRFLMSMTMGSRVIVMVMPMRMAARPRRAGFAPGFQSNLDHDRARIDQVANRFSCF